MSSELALPNAKEAEDQLCGILLINHRFLSHIAAVLPVDALYHKPTRLVYTEILKIDAEGKTPDPYLVAERLSEELRFQQGGAHGYVRSLVTSFVTAESIHAAAAAIRDCAERRRVIEAGQKIVALGMESGTPAEAVEEAQRLAFDLGSKTPRSYRPMSDVVRTTMQQIEQRRTRAPGSRGVSSGFDSIDLKIGGFLPGRLYILAGRPGDGKTALGMDIAQGAAKAGAGVLVFSAEMEAEDLTERALAGEACIDSAGLRRGEMAREAWNSLYCAADVVSGLPIAIDDSSAPSLAQIRSKARRWRTELGDRLGLILIDYLQLLQAGGLRKGREYNRQAEVSEISGGLKALSKDLRVPVLALSQLKRPVDGNPDRRPQLSDLRESGSIEQDADGVYFLFHERTKKPAPNEKPEPAKPTELIFAKQRNGPSGFFVPLRFVGKQTRFEEWPQEPEQGKFAFGRS